MTELNSNNEEKLPGWFWAVAGIGLVWNLLGVMAFVTQITMPAEILAQLPEAEQAYYANMPAWLNYAFGTAVIGGALGCVGLLLKNAFAFPLFILSFVGVLAQNYFSFFMTDMLAEKGTGILVMPILVIVVAIGLILFSHKMIKRKILN